jgi:hypothetical protein
MTAAIVDTHLLLRMLYTALVAGVAVTFVFSIAVYGVTRSGDLRREGRPLASAGCALLGAAGVVLTAGLIVYGIVLLARKR